MVLKTSLNKWKEILYEEPGHRCLTASDKKENDMDSDQSNNNKSKAGHIDGTAGSGAKKVGVHMRAVLINEKLKKPWKEPEDRDYNWKQG